MPFTQQSDYGYIAGGEAHIWVLLPARDPDPPFVFSGVRDSGTVPTTVATMSGESSLRISSDTLDHLHRIHPKCHEEPRRVPLRDTVDLALSALEDELGVDAE